MFGQGSPNFHRCPYRISLRRWSTARVCQYALPKVREAFKDCFHFTLKIAICFAILLLSHLGIDKPETGIAQEQNRLSAAAVETPGDLKLRFAWGGGIPQKWQGKITIENGRFTANRVLAITSDAPSTVIQRSDELFINHRIATSYGGVDTSIELSGDTAIQLELTSPSGEAFKKSWTLEQLAAGVNEPVDNQQNRISVSRAPGDQIRVYPKRPHLVFEPGESWQFETGLQRCGLVDQNVRLKFYWKNPDSNRVPVAGILSELRTDALGSSVAQSVDMKVPNEEGVHDLWIELEPEKSRTSFGQFRRSTKQVRRVQIVVVSNTAPTSESTTDWKEIQSLTAQQLRGSFRVPWPVPRMPGSKEPIRKGDFNIVSVGESNSESAIKFGAEASLAIPVPQLPGKQTGPVRVTLKNRSIPGTKLGINYLSTTQQVLHGMDSGVSVPQYVGNGGTDEAWLTHSFHIWPEDNPGQILVSNMNPLVQAQLGNIKFEAGPERLKSDESAFENSRAETGVLRRERMAFLESPDFSGLFQAQRTMDPQTGQALDDWNTFHSSIDRLTQYLKANFYDGAFVTIAADGSAIFPSFGLAPGPRFDSGVFSSQGCDPIQKDVVELMLRMFDREGLKLVPVLTLNSSLQQLESMRESDLMSFDLVNFEGQPVDFNRSQLPIYNPLDRTLQGVCSQSIARFASRYRNHRSFGGLALSCRPDCCTLLPGTRHGFDRTTMQRFTQSKNIDPASFELNELLVNDPSNETRSAWLTWRSEQMAQWYSDLAVSIRSEVHHRLYLLPIDINKKKAFVSAMSPSLHRSGDFNNVMQSIGLNLDANATQNGVVVLAPKQIAPGFSLAQNRIELNIEQSRNAEQFLAEKTGGSLFTHRGNWRRVDSGDSTVEGSTREQLFTIAGDANRRRYIEAIRKFDSRLFVDGGQSLSFGGESNIEPIVRILRQLPAQPFNDIGDADSGPVCMRQLSVEGQNYFYAVNDSPWPVEVTAWLGQKQLPQVLQASSNSNGKAAPLTTFSGEEVVLEQQNGRTVVRMFLEPWSMFAGTSQTNSAFNPYAIESFDVSLPEQLDSQLRKRLHQLKSKLAKAKTAKPVSQLLNGSFESFVDPNRSGWEFGNHEQANFDLDSSNARDGRTSLSMQTEGKPVWIRSNTMQHSETGRISVSAWLRTNDPESQPQPRISVEGFSDGESIYRFGTIGVSLSDAAAKSLDTDWRRFVVHFDDLPNDITNLRIGFDLMEKGQISIDQVEVFDRWFDENDAVAMTQLLAGAGSQLQSDASIDDARRVLESYWVQFLDQYSGKEEQVVEEEEKQTARPFEIPLPSFELPPFELPNLTPKKAKRVPLFQRFQRRE